MRINIVNYEEGKFDGILSKFAYRMKDELIKLGHEVVVSPVPDSSFEVNHHINYLPYKHNPEYKGIDTLMVTHIWEGYKKDAVLKGLKTAFGVCMSNQTKDKLVAWGADNNNLAVITPAHDGHKRRPIVIAILTNLYPDGCKRVELFQELVKTIDKDKFAFRIMGKDWESILTPMVENGLQVEYFPEFNSTFHRMILDSSDYCLYFGDDEGSMGCLDAKNAGVKIIAPPNGYHKEMGVEFPWKTQDELNKIFEDLSFNPVADWTWERYVTEHLNIWKQN
jgi:hypothetical protein